MISSSQKLHVKLFIAPLAIIQNQILCNNGKDYNFFVQYLPQITGNVRLASIEFQENENSAMLGQPQYTDVDVSDNHGEETCYRSIFCCRIFKNNSVWKSQEQFHSFFQSFT